MKPSVKKIKVIGVLGGMGPESTADFYKKMILQCQQQYGAQYDQDYPEIFIYNLPIPDIVEGLTDPEKTTAMLIQGVKKLEAIGVDVIAMPCNTAHYFYPYMAQAISVPFICIFLATAKKIKNLGYSKVALLGTTTTCTYKSFDDDFERNNIDIIYPEQIDQEILTDIILNVLAGKKEQQDIQHLIYIINKLKKAGAQGAILACTDLPIILTQSNIDIPLFDTTNILAEATIGYALGNIGQEILD